MVCGTADGGRIRRTTYLYHLNNRQTPSRKSACIVSVVFFFAFELPELFLRILLELFPNILQIFLQMDDQRVLAPHIKQEAELDPLGDLPAADPFPQILITDDDLILPGELADSAQHPGGMDQIQQEYAIVHAHAEGIGCHHIGILHKPMEGAVQQRMHQIIVSNSQYSPEQGEQGADDALNVSLAPGVIPQLHFEDTGG